MESMKEKNHGRAKIEQHLTTYIAKQMEHWNPKMNLLIIVKQ